MVYMDVKFGGAYAPFQEEIMKFLNVFCIVIIAFVAGVGTKSFYDYQVGMKKSVDATSQQQQKLQDKVDAQAKIIADQKAAIAKYEQSMKRFKAINTLHMMKTYQLEQTVKKQGNTQKLQMLKMMQINKQKKATNKKASNNIVDPLDMRSDSGE